MPKTVLVWVPHPDDAEFYAGGTIAKMVREGARVVKVFLYRQYIRCEQDR